jgi:hypothetical protein
VTDDRTWGLSDIDPPVLGGSPFHPLAGVYRLLEGAELEALAADIRVNGLHYPIVVYGEPPAILEGRNRYRACLRAGVEATWQRFEGEAVAAKAFVISRNTMRRHDSGYEQAKTARAWMTFKWGGDRRSVDQGSHVSLDRTRAEAPAAFRLLRQRALELDWAALRVWALLVSTVTRWGEACQARWGEFDLERKLWTIPKERMKAGKQHIAPLNSIALGVLERQEKERRNEYVFPSLLGPGPLGYRVCLTGPKRAGIDAGTQHGWRSTFKVWGLKNKQDRLLIELALAHALPVVEGAYLHGDTAVEERRPLMDAYARWLLNEGASVIAFPARA